jgi:hypothetical protein
MALISGCCQACERMLLRILFMLTEFLFMCAALDSDPLLEVWHIKELGEDLVVYERRQAMDDGTLVVAAASLPKEIVTGLLPYALFTVVAWRRRERASVE